MARTSDRSRLRLRRHARVRTKVSGTAECPRLAVHRSNRHISAQLIDDTAGRTLAAASSVEPDLRASLGKSGGGNVSGAESVGRLLGTRAKAAGITSALAVSFVAKHMFLHENYTPPFMLELPAYKLPRLRSVLIGLFTRAKMFLYRAGTTIFAMMVLIWFLASFPRPPEGAEGPAINYSLAAMIGHALQPVLEPIGFN